MKILNVFAAAVILLALYSPLAGASARGGVGVRNGGSSLDCADGTFNMAEVMVASRLGSFPRVIQDREEFFSSAVARIKNPVFSNLVRRQWEAYGDSVNWPEGSIEDYQVYYYVTNLESVSYSRDGIIIADNPHHPLCEDSKNLTDVCCDRILTSFFAADSLKPTKIASHYHSLTRFGRNVLELHEAVYRAALDFGAIPNPYPNPATRMDVEKYLESGSGHGVLPTSHIEALVAGLISDSPISRVSEMVEVIWDWSNGLNGAPSRVSCKLE